MSVLAQKISISIDGNIWEDLKNLKNKSGFINEALRFYFSKKDFIEKAEDEYWKNVEKSILNNNGQYFSLNSDGEKITEEILEEKLWK